MTRFNFSRMAFVAFVIAAVLSGVVPGQSAAAQSTIVVNQKIPFPNKWLENRITGGGTIFRASEDSATFVGNIEESCNHTIDVTQGVIVIDTFGRTVYYPVTYHWFAKNATQESHGETFSGPGPQFGIIFVPNVCIITFFISDVGYIYN